MPGRRNSSLKDPELYEELRDDGASKEKAARISNAAANRGRSNVGRKGGSSTLRGRNAVSMRSTSGAGIYGESFHTARHGV